MQKEDPAKETEQKGPEEKTKNVGILEAQEREFLEVRVATGGPDAQSQGSEGISWIWSLGIFATTTLRERPEAHLSGG